MPGGTTQRTREPEHKASLQNSFNDFDASDKPIDLQLLSNEISADERPHPSNEACYTNVSDPSERESISGA